MTPASAWRTFLRSDPFMRPVTVISSTSLGSSTVIPIVFRASTKRSFFSALLPFAASLNTLLALDAFLRSSAPDRNPVINSMTSVFRSVIFGDALDLDIVADLVALDLVALDLDALDRRHRRADLVALDLDALDRRQPRRRRRADLVALDLDALDRRHRRADLVALDLDALDRRQPRRRRRADLVALDLVALDLDIVADLAAVLDGAPPCLRV
jgi:hypothetical protein